MPQEILPKPLKGNSRQTLVRQAGPSKTAELRSNLLQAQAKQKETPIIYKRRAAEMLLHFIP